MITITIMITINKSLCSLWPLWLWLRLQMNYDIWQARKNASKIKVKPYEFARREIMITITIMITIGAKGSY